MEQPEPHNSPPESPAFPDPPAQPMADTGKREEPRLGIIHLLAWTTCVALYFGITRAFMLMSGAGEPPEVEMLLHWGGWGIGAGTGLGGLWLCGARRYRGLRFPVHPGEYLWSAIGIRTGLDLAIWAVWSLHASDRSGGGPSLVAFLILHFAATILVCLVLLVAAKRIKIPRWRTFLLALVVAYVLGSLLQCAGAGLSGGLFVVLSLIPCGALIVVVLLDVLQRRLYPWPHWVGVGLDLWLYVESTGWLIWVSWLR